MNKQKSEIIKLAKCIEYFESLGCDINPNITTSKLKEHRFVLSKRINLEPISENSKKFKLRTLEEAFDTIKVVLSDRATREKKIKSAKNWLKNRNLDIEEKRKEQKSKDIVQESENLPSDEIIIEYADLEQYKTALENVGDQIIIEELNGEEVNIELNKEEIGIKTDEDKELEIEEINVEIDAEEIEDEEISVEIDVEEVSAEIDKDDVEDVIDVEMDGREDGVDEKTEDEFTKQSSMGESHIDLSTRKTSYSFNRENNGSLVQIIEIQTDGMELAIDDTESRFSRLEDEYVSTYIILEESNDGKIKEIDYLYGYIDFEWLTTSEEAKKYLDSVLSRDILNESIRKYCGILPEFSIKKSGETIINWNIDTVTRISEKVLLNAYTGKSANINVQEPSTSKNSSKRPKIEKFEKQPGMTWWESFKKYSTRNLDQPREEYGFGKKFMEYATRNLDKPEIEEKRIIFFKSGVIICNGIVCNRYSYHMENSDDNGKRELYSFIVTNIDEEKLDTDPIYKQNVINTICTSKKLEKIKKQKYSYLGNIKDDGTLVDNLRMSKYFGKLNAESAKELDK